MASWAKRLPGNVEGDFYVDSTCIDCAACRWIAPASFDAEGEVSVVAKQPESAHEIRRAEMAILACPVGCIGTRQKRSLRAAQEAFPDPIAAQARTSQTAEAYADFVMRVPAYRAILLARHENESLKRTMIGLRSYVPSSK